MKTEADGEGPAGCVEDMTTGADTPPTPGIRPTPGDTPPSGDTPRRYKPRTDSGGSSGWPMALHGLERLLVVLWGGHDPGHRSGYDALAFLLDVTPLRGIHGQWAAALTGVPVRGLRPALEKSPTLAAVVRRRGWRVEIRHHGWTGKKMTWLVRPEDLDDVRRSVPGLWDLELPYLDEGLWDVGRQRDY